MLLKWLLSIRGRTCNRTPLVHQDMPRKQPFMKKIRRDNSSKMYDNISFLSSVLPFMNIYVCTKFNFNPFSTFQDMARISNPYEKNGYGQITQYM